MQHEDLYEILQISPNAEPAVVEGAYRRLAAKYHPDVNPSADAHQRIVAINRAYEVLGDPSRRSVYDQERRSTIARGRQPASARGVRSGKSGSVGWLGTVAVFCLLSGLSTFALHPGRSLPLILVGAALVAWIAFRLSHPKPS